MDRLDKVHKALRKARERGDTEAEQFLLMDLAEATQGLREEAGRGEVARLGAGGRVLAGVGQGMTNVGMNVADIAGRVPGLGGIRPSEETWQEMQRAAGPLKETTGGAVGSFAGETAAAMPLGMGAGKVVGSLGGQLLGRGAPLAKFLARPLGQAAIQGSAEGAVLAGPGNRGTGALVGGLGGAGAVGLGALLRRGYQGVVQPSAAAKYLQRQGVEDLTLGQMAPRSALGQLEESATSFPLMGPAIKAQREAGQKAVQSAVLREARAPGSALAAKEGSIAGRLSAIYDDFERAYDPIRKQAIRPVALAGKVAVPLRDAMRSAAQDPSALAPDETVKRIARFLDNEATVLGRSPAQAATALRGVSVRGAGGRFGAAPAVEAGDLLRVRSNVRRAVSESLQRQDYPAARLLENAEEVLTKSLESQLPPDMSKALRTTDAQYAKFKVVSDAVRRSADRPEGFTMTELGASVRKATEPGSYSRGAGGPLRRLAAAGRETLDQRVPMTGARMFLTPVGIATAPLTTTKTVKRLLTGATGPQRAAQQMELALRRSLGPTGRRRARKAAVAASGVAGGRMAKED